MAMTGVLRPGQTVGTVGSPTRCKVGRLLGGGGQGEVYEADLGGRPVALKWYHRHTATAKQRKALEQLIAKGSPADQFLWPLFLAEEPGIPSYGYVMALRDSRFRNTSDLMTRRIEPTFRCVATAAFHLASAFLELHARGLCYCDISFSNIFIDPQNGDIRICDNDNVGIDRAADAAVGGTPRFMAPEIVRCERKPCRETDQYSLAVLLFYMLVMHHPLEGAHEAAIRCMDVPAMNMIYGKEPLFIFDPANPSNAPVPGIHGNAIEFWPLYPSFLRALFVQSFTDGLRDTQRRVTDSQWRKALVRLRDAIMHCDRCGSELFYESDPSEAAGRRCWSCRAPLHNPWRLTIGGQAVVLNGDTRLYPHHLHAAPTYDFTAPAAEVTRHPTDPNVWGLKNLTSATWTMTVAGGDVREVPPGRSLPLAVGTRIAFGSVDGVIEG
jgi:DNA-binding helix-hairpin-helix protein with protein kinase domain